MSHVLQPVAPAIPILPDEKDGRWAQFRARFEPGSPWFTLLTPAEQVVTMHLRVGLSNKEIANVLNKSPATVKAQIASILRKVQVPTRGRLIAWIHDEMERRFAR